MLHPNDASLGTGAPPPTLDVDALREAEAFYRLTLDAVPAGVILYQVGADRSPVPILANPAALDILGVTLEELQAHTRGDRAHELLDHDGGPLDRSRTPVARLLGEHAPLDGQLWGVRRPGTDTVWVRSSGRTLPGPDGEATGLVVSMVDVTDDIRAYDELEVAHARYEALIEHSTEVIVVMTPDGTTLYASPSFERLLGRRGGISLLDRMHPVDLVRAQIELVEMARCDHPVTRFRCRVAADDGAYRHLDVAFANRLADPAIGGIVANCRDVTEQVEVAAELAHHATHDQLTGLANRSLIVDRLAAAVARSRCANRPLAVLLLGLDGFQRVNDTLGRRAGDLILTEVAARISATLRPGDAVARLSGDEYVVVAEGLEARADAVCLAERLRAVVAQPLEVAGRRMAMGCSVGISTCTADDPDTLLQEASIALFRAKAQGRGRSQVYSAAMLDVARDRLDAEDLVRSALDEDRVVTLFQPIVDLQTRQATGVEALVRIRATDGSLVAPDRFIAAAEDSGLIVPLGERVLDQACAQLACWEAAGLALSRATVNLSARQLTAGNLPEVIDRTLRRHRLDAHRLGLEITESSLIDAGTSARHQMDQLKEQGVSLFLDDFGTGWSSLAYLRQFPVDGLKVDRSFVGGLGQGTGDTELVRAIVSLGRSLSLSVIAEGVETECQAAELLRLRCRSAQGYLFARPGTAADLAPLLHAGAVA